ncbi:hypothetical protein TNCV_1413881 [Trichonephila clavipes]|nr:hypothetical protein TNCV_1413881 [Trichonephila clavipes]
MRRNSTAEMQPDLFERVRQFSVNRCRLFCDQRGCNFGIIPVRITCSCISDVELWFESEILTSHCSATRGLLVTDLVILNHNQVTLTSPELIPPLLTTTPNSHDPIP